ncbi:Protein of unknown function [Pyronema omphalodes CBS 100304]|uniref:Uncharacterized protein n=1 Tax=Pyronema omphalodes (strain CBS 100304) TaxID=1076935 RepID=U4LC21_PYROM|nr:Protein of unknown function [Pyronema omphalodes CBS 100304]
MVRGKAFTRIIGPRKRHTSSPRSYPTQPEAHSAHLTWAPAAGQTPTGHANLGVGGGLAKGTNPQLTLPPSKKLPMNTERVNQKNHPESGSISEERRFLLANHTLHLGSRPIKKSGSKLENPSTTSSNHRLTTSLSPVNKAI